MRVNRVSFRWGRKAGVRTMEDTDSTKLPRGVGSGQGRSSTAFGGYSTPSPPS